MKIGFLTQNEAPFRMMWVDELAKYADVIVYHVGEYEKNFNIDFLSYKAQRAKVNNLKEHEKRFFNINDIIRDNCDVYILDGYGFFAQTLAILSLWIRRKPFIMSIDGGFVKKERITKRLTKKFLISRAKAFFSTSEETDKFIRYYVEDKKIYRHRFSSLMSSDIKAIPSKAEKDNLRDKLEINKNGFIVIAVGKFIPIKGFDVLIKAAKYIEGDFEIYFIGSDEPNLYNNEIDESIKSRIKFIGFCNKERLQEYYRASDVMAFPTRGDVWGLVIGEAMSNGLPIVSSNMCLAGLALIKDGKNGFVTKVEDYKELADRLQFLLDNPNICRTMGETNIREIKPYCIDIATREDIVNLKDYIENE